jgi:hypothetical protein
MTEPHFETQSPDTRPISVAELLARNGTIGAPAVTTRHRRRRGGSDAVTVAELTGEIPVIRDDHYDEIDQPTQTGHTPQSNGGVLLAESVTYELPEPVLQEISEEEEVDWGQTPYWSEPEPRWPKSPPQTRREPGPQRSAYPRPLRHHGRLDAECDGDEVHLPEPQFGAERMRPDPVAHYADIPVDVIDTDVREAQPATEDSAYVRSYLSASPGPLRGREVIAAAVERRGLGVADEQAEPEGGQLLAAHEELDEDYLDLEEELASEVEGFYRRPGRIDTIVRGGLIVLQSITAVGFGAGLFIAFDQLWRWNNIVALVLSVLVILGLVVGVRVVRKTEDIVSTLIAVAVGALITLGPLALLQSS